jgi:hypothetical protein
MAGRSEGEDIGEKKKIGMSKHAPGGKSIGRMKKKQSGTGIF